MSASKAETRVPNHAEAAAFRVDLLELLFAHQGKGGLTLADVLGALEQKHPWVSKTVARGLISDVLHWGWGYSTGGKVEGSDEKYHVTAMGQTILLLVRRP